MSGNAPAVRNGALPGLLMIRPKVFEDSRGFFMESFNYEAFIQATGLDGKFVQDNLSRSVQGVLRGLHYQLRRPQGKLVWVVEGDILDVVVDIRRSSGSFGQWAGTRLSGTSHEQLWVPPGFAHGFVALSSTATVVYKTTDFHTPDDEYCIAWDDPALAIDWPGSTAPLLSPKDRNGLLLADAPLFT